MRPPGRPRRPGGERASLHSDNDDAAFRLVTLIVRFAGRRPILVCQRQLEKGTFVTPPAFLFFAATDLLYDPGLEHGRRPPLLWLAISLPRSQVPGQHASTISYIDTFTTVIKPKRRNQLLPSFILRRQSWANATEKDRSKVTPRSRPRSRPEIADAPGSTTGEIARAMGRRPRRPPRYGTGRRPFRLHVGPLRGRTRRHRPRASARGFRADHGGRRRP
jgi:hypothetical protein